MKWFGKLCMVIAIAMTCTACEMNNMGPKEEVVHRITLPLERITDTGILEEEVKESVQAAAEAEDLLAKQIRETTWSLGDVKIDGDQAEVEVSVTGYDIGSAVYYALGGLDEMETDGLTETDRKELAQAELYKNLVNELRVMESNEIRIKKQMVVRLKKELFGWAMDAEDADALADALAGGFYSGFKAFGME